MQRRFEDEVAELAGTYKAAAALLTSQPEVAAVQRELAESPAVFVGSGGALAVAAVAADEHTWRTGRLGAAATPLRLAGPLRDVAASVVLFSARARHHDVLAAARLARSGHRTVLVTGRAAEDIDPRLRALLDHVIQLPPASPDGFLATNSVLTFLTGWLGANSSLPAVLPALQEPPTEIPSVDFRRLLVLHGMNGTGPALDLEARLSESGLADVQIADYRNVAHGRHVGLAARSADTLVVALRDADDAGLAERTLSLLPKRIQTLELTSPFSFPISAVDQTVRVIRLFGQLSAARDIDPGHPRVPEFGRRLYHLRWHGTTTSVPSPVRRKLMAVSSSARGQLVDKYSSAYEVWSAQMRSTRFTGSRRPLGGYRNLALTAGC